MSRVVMALAAHPDDIEFMMAGTLLQLQGRGFEIHYCNLASGCCGHNGYPAREVAKMREKEAKESAEKMQAVFHHSIFNDLEIFYNEETIRKVSAIIRAVAPDILLVHSLNDYMEDHVNAARLGVAAAFSRGMNNWETIPAVMPVSKDCAVYHAMPFGLHDGLNRPVRSGFYVDITNVIEKKQRLLACHKSQQEWLSKSQSMNSYLLHMRHLSEQMGALSQKYKFAEGWSQHNPAGLCPIGQNPLRELLDDISIRDEMFEGSFAFA